MPFDLSERELQTYEALYNNLGARILFKCDKVSYIGIIDVILPESHLVKLRHTKTAGDETYFGSLRFKFKEISSFTVIESSESVNRYPKNDYLLNILKNSRPVDRATAAKILYSDKLSDDDTTDEENNEVKFVLDLPEHLKNKLPSNHVLIDTIGEDFNEAIKCMSIQPVIGVSFHGHRISRFGKLTFICVGTNVCLFVFDVHKMGKEVFDKGLRQVLESKDVKKIIHDCRFASDCLAHQYNTLLLNVFDTRVADFVINRQQYRGKQEFHSWTSLDCLLRWYLRVPQEFLFERVTTQSGRNQETILHKRPISNDLLYDLLKSVLYLIILQEELSKRLLMPMHRATGFHRTILAHSSDTLINDLGSDLTRPDNIIPGLLMNGIQIVRFRKPQKIISLKCKFIHPQTGKVIDSEVTSNLTTTVTSSLLRERKMSVLFEKKDMNECHEISIKKEDINNVVPKASNYEDENVTEEGTCDNLFTKVSFRQLDEIYHKLANSMNQSENIINVKPSVNNHNPGLSDRQYFAACSNNVDFSKNVKNTAKKSSESSCEPSKASDECSDIWLKIRKEYIEEKAKYSHANYSNKKIQFLPG